ncbi:alkaline phosphatase family protein [Nocardia terrae]|uniref:alkaline phosphatase family protein n=1 Tax=Nocardia terrae TaxID=2675851 RepID=UPI0012F73ADA|nr:alkaline phosphatase family protein [Nocardia terrae]
MAATVSAFSGLVGATASADPGHGQGAAPEHIFYIMMENQGDDDILGNTADAPFINQLANDYGVSTGFHGVTHPSLPNYLSMFSGDFQGIWDDCKAGADSKCAPEEFVPNSGDGTSGAALTPEQITSATNKPHMFAGKNLVDELEGKGKSWKAYMGAMPSAGFAGATAPIGDTGVSLYAQKHNPFMYFSDVTSDNARLQKVVPFENNFDADLKSGNVPAFTWISPDLCQDMHGMSASNAAKINQPKCAYPDSGVSHGPIQTGDAYLKDTITKIMNSDTWKKTRSSIVVAWDENDYSGFSGGPGSPVGANGVVLGGGDAPLLVINSDKVHKEKGEPGKPAPHHKVSTDVTDHYSVLSSIEHLWDLGCLANTCQHKAPESFKDLFEN